MVYAQRSKARALPLATFGATDRVIQWEDARR
jgi:hypothetical protein